MKMCCRGERERQEREESCDGFSEHGERRRNLTCFLRVARTGATGFTSPPLYTSSCTFTGHTQVRKPRQYTKKYFLPEFGQVFGYALANANA